MFCSQCGQKLNDDAKFCARCGAKVVTLPAAEPAAAPEPAPAATPVEVQTAPAEQVATPVTPAEQVAAPVTPAEQVAAPVAPAVETVPVVMDEIPHTEEPAGASEPVAPLPMAAAAQPVMSEPVYAAAEPVYAAPVQPAAEPVYAAPAQPVATPVAPAKPKKKKKKIWLVILLVLFGLFIAFILVLIILVAIFIKPIRSYVEKVKDSGFVETSFTWEDESQTTSEETTETPSEEINPFGGEDDPFGNKESSDPVSDEDISGLTLKGNVAISKVSGADEMIRYIQQITGKMLSEEEMNRIRMPDIFSAMDQFEMNIKDYDDVENGWAVTFPVASGSECKPVSLGIRDFIKDGETLNPIRIHLDNNKFSIQRQVPDKNEAFAKQIFPEYYAKMSNGTYGIMLNGTFAKSEDKDGEEIFKVSGYMQIMLWYDTMSEPYTLMYHYDASTKEEDGDKK